MLELSHSGYYRAADMTFTRHMAECGWSYNKVEWGWGWDNVELYHTVTVGMKLPDCRLCFWEMALNIKNPFFFLSDQWCLRSHLELAVLHPSHHHRILLCSQPCPGSAFRVSSLTLLLWATRWEPVPPDSGQFSSLNYHLEDTVPMPF